MNPSGNTTEQQGDPNWTTENWDQPGSGGALDSARPYTANRLDWDWDNPMILAQHPGAGANDGDSDRKSPMAGSSLSSNLRAYTGMLQPAYSSPFSQNPLGIFSSSGIRSFGGIDSTSSSSALHGGLSSTSMSGIPGLAPTSGNHGELRSPYEGRRRQYLGATDLDQKGQSGEIQIKREEVTSDGHGVHIGLNLGKRTYFATEDTAAGRIGKRHRANSPGSQVPMCQAEGCKADLSIAKHYHRRHKVCESHSKAPNVVAAGCTQRFCQQCSRFHPLTEFDEGKRSCRKRLADHNRRRRKLQPTASTGGTTADSVALKTDDQDNRTTASTDAKSMLLQLKKSGSPSSASLDDSDEKTGSAGNNLQLRTSAGFIRQDDRPSHAVLLNSQANALSAPEAQNILSAMSLSPPVPLMLPSAKRQLSILPTHPRDASVFQHFMQGVGQTGTNLSLSSFGGGLGLGSQAQRCSSGQNFNGIEPQVPWLRPLGSRTDLTQTGDRPTMNLQHLMSEKNVTGSTHPVASSGNPPGQVYSPSIQNLLPSIQTSREISGSEWMLGSLAGQNRDNSTQFGSSALNMSGGQLEGHPMLALLEGPAIQEGTSGGGQQSRAPMEFLQHHATDGADGTRSGVTDLKFPDLQVLRTSSFGPSSIYDTHHNIL